jgi:hypothetical protein
MEILISQMLLNSLAGMNACEQLANDNVLELFTFKNKTYVILVVVSSAATGVSSVRANECVLSDYFEAQTATYNQHCLDVIDGKIERGYSNSNILFNHKKKQWVIIGETVTFLPLKEDKQLEFF